MFKQVLNLILEKGKTQYTINSTCPATVLFGFPTYGRAITTEQNKKKCERYKTVEYRTLHRLNYMTTEY